MKTMVVLFVSVCVVLPSLCGAAGKTPDATPKREKAGDAAAETPKDAPDSAKEEKKAEANKAEANKTKEVEDDGRRSALKSLVVLKVLNPRDAKAAVQAEAERLKGYMSYIDNHSIVLKVPPKALSEMVQFTADQGLVIEKNLEREDLTLEVAELEGRLKSKREILSRLRGFFDDSDAVATLEIEQTMNGLVMEIEQTRGRLRYLNDRSDWAVLNISFRFRERDKVMYVESDFEWLNTASLDQFLGEFQP
jgi:hypothetical protein